MDTQQLIALGGSIFAAAATGYFFFGPRSRTKAAVDHDGRQQIELKVDGGYSPDRIVLKAGQPSRIYARREDRSACSAQIVFSDLGISRGLPTGERVAIDLPALPAGRYPFTCGMSMLRGELQIEA